MRAESSGSIKYTLLKVINADTIRIVNEESQLVLALLDGDTNSKNDSTKVVFWPIKQNAPGQLWKIAYGEKQIQSNE